MNESALTLIKEPIPRDRWQRPLITPPEGGKLFPYTRCTTFVDCLDDKTNLFKWKTRMTTLGLAARSDLHMAAVSTDPTDKKALDRIAEEAQEAAGASAAATLGTAIHALTERIDRGEELTNVPLAYVPDLAAYREATSAFTIDQIETFGVHDGLKIGGTWDRIITLDGVQYLADIKTGGIDYAALKIAMQLAVYSRCQEYDHMTNTRTPLKVDQDRALIIHLPAGTGTCNLVWIDIAAGWEAVQVASQVRQWRSRANKLTTPFASAITPAADVDAPPAAAVDAPPAATPKEAALINAIHTAATIKELNDLWEQHQNIWSDVSTQAAKARKNSLAVSPA